MKTKKNAVLRLLAKQFDLFKYAATKDLDRTVEFWLEDLEEIPTEHIQRATKELFRTAKSPLLPLDIINASHKYTQQEHQKQGSDEHKALLLSLNGDAE